MARLHEKYRESVFADLQKEFGLTNPMQVPRIEKITCNIGVGEASRNAKLLDTALEQLTSITGQKPVMRRAPQEHRGLQAPRGHAGWRQSHFEKRADVRVPRPVNQHWSASCP